ncbi:MAG: endolytic transglycosylase MltG, partial [Microbacterium sp.]|nr:endolytic transglycosylase MltG [Microbacterium sp.]
MPDPGRQNESHPPRLNDLFDNLPTAGSQLPQPDHTPPPAGSRRAARRAREASGAIPVVSEQAAQEAAAQQAAQQQFLAQQQAAAAHFAAQQQAAAEQFAAQQRAAQQAAAAQLAAQQQAAAQAAAQQMQQPQASAPQQVPAQQPVAPVQPEGAAQSRPAAVEQPQPVVPLSAAEPARRGPEAPSITGPFSITVTGSQAIAEQQTASFPIMTVPAYQAADEASRATASAPEPAQQPNPQAAAFQPEPARRPASQEPTEQAPTPAAAAPDAETDVFGGGGSDGPHEFDSLFAPEAHHEPKKKKRGKGCLISLIVLLAILGGIAGAGAWVYNTYSDKINEVMGWGPTKDYEPGQASGEAFVTIKDGDTGQPISTALNAAGVTKTPSVFYDMLVKKGVSPTFYPGVYKLQKKMTAEAALKALQDDANRMENTASVPEGGQIKNFLPTVAESLGMPLADLQAAVKNPADYGVKATSLEGWLFPAVYTFDPGST